ncbi:MAG: ABC transporter permease [Spirochaetota bacterium]
MRGFTALLRKELRSSFNSPVAFIVVAGFLALSASWTFVINDFFAEGVASLRGYFGIMPIVFVVLVPAITMRVWAEERRAGTDEILLTLPVDEWTLVLAKYASSLFLVLIAIGLTVFVPISVRRLGDFERGEILGQYIGLVLLAGSGVAVGQLASSLARNQISAFVISALTLLAFSLVGEVGTIINLPDSLASFLRYLSFDAHYRNFIRGILDTRDLVFFVGLSALMLVVNTRVLVLRKFR